jgi:hypothetical protein
LEVAAAVHITAVVAQIKMEFLEVLVEEEDGGVVGQHLAVLELLVKASLAVQMLSRPQIHIRLAAVAVLALLVIIPPLLMFLALVALDWFLQLTVHPYIGVVEVAVVVKTELLEMAV